MKLTKFFRENLILCLGIMVPVLVMGVFFVAASVRETAPPQYDVLLESDQDYGTPRPPFEAYVFVRDHTLYAQYSALDPVRQTGTVPKLYLYEASSGKLRQLDFPPPDTSDSSIYGKQLPVESAKSMKIDTSLTSPDGYEFTYSADNDDRGGLINELFVGEYNRYGPRLKKDGSSFILSPPPTYGQFRFLGWVMKPGQTHE